MKVFVFLFLTLAGFVSLADDKDTPTNFSRTCMVTLDFENSTFSFDEEKCQNVEEECNEWLSKYYEPTAKCGKTEPLYKSKKCSFSLEEVSAKEAYYNTTNKFRLDYTAENRCGMPAAGNAGVQSRNWKPIKIYPKHSGDTQPRDH